MKYKAVVLGIHILNCLRIAKQCKMGVLYKVIIYKLHYSYHYKYSSRKTNEQTEKVSRM